jgi:DNA-directed RNA polymerase subunit L
MEKTDILGISFSTRMLGLVVFKSNSPIDYSLKCYKEKWTLQKKEMLIANLKTCVTAYSIKHIALTKPKSFHQTKECIEILEAIQQFANTQNLKLYVYPVADLYRAFGNRIKATRVSLIRRMSLFYPEFEYYETKELQNKNKYYIKLFEAVACASYHILALQDRKD